jgi:hypothetical protein
MPLISSGTHTHTHTALNPPAKPRLPPPAWHDQPFCMEKQYFPITTPYITPFTEPDLTVSSAIATTIASLAYSATGYGFDD